MAFNLRINLDLRRTTKLKRIRPSDTTQDTPSHPATRNALPTNNRENISENNIIEVEHHATSINPDFHTTNTGKDTNLDQPKQEKSQNSLKQLV